ncbi:uncharacterized protein LOC143226900 isoform X2 [Tachypleus tridentatus]|uniref:uncharacterized protein LOC143226900 isoform X2 n=1 Tax=Tachypleus tridentatus TaxID=6853 RepID=UPI003FD4FD9A
MIRISVSEENEHLNLITDAFKMKKKPRSSPSPWKPRPNSAGMHIKCTTPETPQSKEKKETTLASPVTPVTSTPRAGRLRTPITPLSTARVRRLRTPITPSSTPGVGRLRSRWLCSQENQGDIIWDCTSPSQRKLDSAKCPIGEEITEIVNFIPVKKQKGCASQDIDQIRLVEKWMSKENFVSYSSEGKSKSPTVRSENSRLSGLRSVEALLDQISNKTSAKSLPSEEDDETRTVNVDSTNSSVKETLACNDTEAPLPRDLQSENYGDESVEQLWGDDEDESLLLKATQISFTLDEESLENLNRDVNLRKCSEVQPLDFPSVKSTESSGFQRTYIHSTNSCNVETANTQVTRSCNVQIVCTQATSSSSSQITDNHSMIPRFASLSNNKQPRSINVLPKRLSRNQSVLFSDIQKLDLSTGQYVRVLPKETSKDIIGQSKNNCFKSSDTCGIRSSAGSGEGQSKRNMLSRNQGFQRNVKTAKCTHLADSKKLGLRYFVSNSQCYQKVTMKDRLKSQSNKSDTLITKSCPSSCSGQVKQDAQTYLTEHVETEDLDKLYFQDENDLDEILKSLPEEVIMGVSVNNNNCALPTFISHGEDITTQSKTWRSHADGISASCTETSESFELSPEVMSWLDEVDSSSQPSSSQTCSSDEIAKKREEAIRRRQKKQLERQLLDSRGDSVWQGRLRSPRGPTSVGQSLS